MVETHVVYLVWPPMGVEPVERFAASYLDHEAGTEHRLVVALKGRAPDAFAKRIDALVGELEAATVHLPATGRDLDSYRALADRLSAAAICFLNTSSEILCADWLSVLRSALERPGVGMVGCTGSFESALSAAPRPVRPFLRRRYPPFPNPHLRTNAFLLRAALARDLNWHAAGGKRRALELESGAASITRQVRSRRLLTLVAGRDGRSFEPEQWPESRTFRSGEQENLMIADNRTRQYASADGPRRAELAAYAWGHDPRLSSAPLAREP